MNTKIQLIFIWLFCIYTIQSQVLKYDGYIQTRKLFLFGPDNGFQYAQFQSTHNFLFQRQFDNVPRVGLAVYTLDFQYSPDFSCRITAATNKTATSIKITSINTNTNNRLYIMYMATDHVQIGIFVPDRLQTTDLNLPIRSKNFQNFDFNYKQQISQLAFNAADIKLTVYLTGLSSTSQMTTNGYPTNRTSVSLRAYSSSTRFYSIQIMIGQQFPQISVDWVQCTVVYFIPRILIDNRYQINSGAVTLKAYGGTIEPVTQSVDFLPLDNNNKFQDLQYFFGISRIQCKDGQSITLLGVQKYYTSPQDKSVRLLLQMQTWKLTYMQISSFNYIQYKSLKCSQPGANCPSVCSVGLRPYYIIKNQCNYCHYSCASCNKTNSDSYCDSCDITRVLNNNTHLCDCTPGYYETRNSSQCASCFPCKTCDASLTCLTCLDNQNMILNSVTNQCQCKAGYYANKDINGSLNKQEPCLKCSDNCLYCLNRTVCLACSINSYLSKGVCLLICNQNQKYIEQNNTCVFYGDDLYDQNGRLGFDWSYRLQQNQMLIDLVFSQTNMAYYYFQNGIGYTYQDYIKQLNQGGSASGDSSGSSFYYDDGINYGGYTQNFYTINSAGSSSSSSSGSSQSSGSSSGSGSNSDSGSGSSAGSGSGSSSNNNIVIIDQSALKGQYYGYGQTRFFQILYQNSNSYKNQYGIPYGKYKISTSPNISNPNYIEALSRNLIFKISGQVIPYTMEGISNNHFLLRTRPTKTYLNALGAIQIKNAGLVRAGKTALQKRIVTKQITRFDYYTQQQLNSAHNIKKSNEVLVDILWGLCKYFLFIGFGWPFIPIMLALQYIMSFNYIHSSLPLNLDYFLSSFRDFRNPSIFYNPFRNQFDAKVVNHPNIYKSVPQLQEFDRGLDFMKNCWEFFFIPILAFALLLLLFLLNMLFRACCRRDFCMISKFLVPRIPLLIAAYTLVQALPVSFFFFSQLKDTTFRHPLQPNLAYPTFNTAMAYLAFFLTCAIPILLLAWLYYHFNYGNRITKFSDANVFNKKFLNRIDNQSGRFSRAQLHDPLWGGDHVRTGTYILGIAVFALAIMFGFFIAFFIKDFAWQLAGIIFFSVLFLAFIISASFFKDKVIKIFFIIFMVLMIAYLLLHAGISSNRAIGTYDQWNVGYLGIGILYAFLITAILFTAYLLYRFFKQAYQNHKRYGCWIDIDKKDQAPIQRKQVERVTQYRNDTKMRSTFLKNGVSGIAGGALGTNLIRSTFNQNQLTSNVKKVYIPGQDNLYSQQRLITRTYVPAENTNWDELVFNKQDPLKKQIVFNTKNNNMIFGFPVQNGRYLMTRGPLYIDNDNRIYDSNKQFIDYYHNLSKRKPQNNNENIFVSNNNNIIGNSQRTVITTQKQIYLIDEEEWQKVGDQGNGKVRLKNMRTGQLKIIDLNKFLKNSQSHLEYHTSSDVKIPSNYKTQTQYDVLSSGQLNKNIIYNGQQYIDLGYDPYTRQYKVINMRNNSIDRVPRSRYLNMIDQSSKKRININGQPYDYQGTDASGKVYLQNTRTGQNINLKESQFQKYRQLNLKAFHDKLAKQQANKQKPQIIRYQGSQYQVYGQDQQGRHRLFSPALQKHILLTDYQFRNLYGNNNKTALQGSQNLLLVQSSVGTMKKAYEDEGRKIGQLRLNSQTSRYYIYEEDLGNQYYLPKSKINPDMPLEIDENGNIYQNGRFIVKYQDAKKGNVNNSYKKHTQTLIGSNRVVNPILEDDNFVQGYKMESKIKQQHQAQQVINPNGYYRILGIPQDKVDDFNFRQKDIYFTQRNVKGKDVMAKIQAIQNKYSNLRLLVKNQSDESQQIWVN